MTQHFRNYDVKSINTFGIHANTDELLIVSTIEELSAFLNQRYRQIPLLIMGGGSNILFTSDFHGIILKPEIKGIQKIMETDNEVFVEAGAGVEWDDLVSWTVENDLSGLENLSLIPGKVGACPIQNIGAYGVEVKDTIESVEGLYLENGSKFIFKNKDCQFDYRYSIFKSSLKNKCVITKVVFRLNKTHKFILNYGALEEEVAKMGMVNLYNIRQAVINIRNSKLPDHKVIGNAGSFFKNPFISIEKANSIKQKYPNFPLYEAGHGLLKASAAFLIDKAGWKGFRRGDAGVHDKQPLVLVNHANANGQEIASLAKEIQTDVFQKFGVELEMEVNFV